MSLRQQVFILKTGVKVSLADSMWITLSLSTTKPYRHASESVVAQAVLRP